MSSKKQDAVEEVQKDLAKAENDGGKDEQNLMKKLQKLLPNQDKDTLQKEKVAGGISISFLFMVGCSLWVLREYVLPKVIGYLVKSAAEVLANFYKDNNLNLMQNEKHAEPPVVTAGEAPPPPPPTWEEPYAGATGESGGIVAILQMIENDITKDRTKAKQEEDDAQKEFDDFEKDSNSQIKDLEDAVTSLEDEVSEKEDTVASEKESRGDKKNGLDATMSKIKDALPGCDFVAVNFELRNKNRQIEIDGLDKAKAILKGAEFD